MADLKNITINELPFKEKLEESNILHLYDGQDKQSTLLRLEDWAKSRVNFTTDPKFKNVLLSTSDKKMERIPLESFLQGSLGGLMNALVPLQGETLINAGFSELEIFVYRVARKSSLRELGEYFYMDIKDDGLLHEFLNSSSAKAYLLSFGITLANGENGSRDARGVFLRAVDAGAGRESEERQIGQLQRDAFQGHRIESLKYNEATFKGFTSVNPAGIGLKVPNGFELQGLNKSGNMNLTGSFFDDGEHGDPRIASETRPQNITALLFQKVGEIHWQNIPAEPPRFLREDY